MQNNESPQHNNALSTDHLQLKLWIDFMCFSPVVEEFRNFGHVVLDSFVFYRAIGTRLGPVIMPLITGLKRMKRA